jgi:RNA polymerase sigma-70 factor (ECF subfamily)
MDSPVQMSALTNKSEEAAMDALAVHDIEKHRPHLVKFALLQLRNQAQAEDAVQETLLAALSSADRFAGRSSVRTWLIGILKHKCIDQLRRASREQPLDLDPEESSLDEFDALFQRDGHYVEMPADWGDPEETLSQQKFFGVLERCMEGLPRNSARVFHMREVLGLETDEICKELGITTTNCGVLLYRARMGLRECLQQRWFAAGG